MDVSVPRIENSPDFENTWFVVRSSRAPEREFLAMVYRKGEPLIERVLTELCVIYGFCLKPDDHAAMLEMSIDDLDAWTRAVFEREGLLDPFEKRLWQDVRNHVGQRLTHRA